MFVRYVKTCLNTLSKDHWYTLLEQGHIITESGKITLVPVDSEDPTMLIIEDYVTGLVFEVSVERLVLKVGKGSDAREYVFDSVTEMERASQNFRMAIRDMRRSIERIAGCVKLPLSERVDRFFQSKLNIAAVGLAILQVLLLLHHIELLFK